MAAAICHPDRPHKAKGLCVSCYSMQRRGSRRATCHPALPVLAKGLCESCYRKRRRANNPSKANPNKATCHPDRPMKSKGLCGSCYNRQRVNPRKASCHPDRPHEARGLCNPCITRRRQLKKYGLTPEQYDEMASNQDGKCAICGRSDGGGRSSIRQLHVDHDHETGEVRSLLCHSCNTGLGHFKENPSLLAAAILYLDEHRGPGPEDAPGFGDDRGL